MTEELAFESFPKLYRLNGPVIVTEKIDGTNAQIVIGEAGEFKVGSRTRWITPESDNHGFARYAYANRDKLIELLGIGRHYGEWWGKGIQRGYGLQEKRFSLFNTSKWNDPLNTLRAVNIDIVPILWTGIFDTLQFAILLNQLKEIGSYAAPGYMNPEGIVIYDTRSGVGYKKTFDYPEGKNMARDIDSNPIGLSMSEGFPLA